MPDGYLLTASFADRFGDPGQASRIIAAWDAEQARDEMSALLTRAGCSKIDITNHGKGKYMRNPPTSRDGLVEFGAKLIAEVSSLPDADEDRAETVSFTMLSLWWSGDEDRPFVAVVEGRRGPAAPAHYVDKWKAQSFGTLGRALNSFEASNLRDDLAAAIPADAESAFPDANALRAKKGAALRGYKGEPTIIGAARWLYGDKGTQTDLARALEADFHIPFRTAFNALGGAPTTGWAKAFVAALKHFDRRQWRSEKGGGHDVQ